MSEPTLAQVQAVLAVMRVNGLLSAEVVAGWDVLMQFLPLYAAELRRSAEDYDKAAPPECRREPVLTPWEMPAREVLADIRDLMKHTAADRELFDSVASVLPEIATTLRA